MAYNQLLTNAEQGILITLATNDKKTYNQLLKILKEKEIAKSNRTVLYSLKKIEFLELVCAQKTENLGSGDKGRRATIYSLTFDGLILSLYYSLKRGTSDFKATITETAKKQKRLLPLIFGKWFFYEENKLLDEVVLRLALALNVIGTKIEDIVAIRRIRLESLKKSEEAFKKALKRLKKELTGSEKKGFPRHPVYMSKQESEQLARGLLKNLLEVTQETSQQTRKNVYTEAEELSKAMKLIDEGVTEVFSRDFNAVFLFGSKDYIISPEKQKKFLQIVCRDADLKAFAIECLLELEEKQEKFLGNIRSWKEIIL